MNKISFIISTGTIGLTFDQIAKAIGRNEVWLAAAFYGQVRPNSHVRSILINIHTIILSRPNLPTKSSLKFPRSWKSLLRNLLERWESIGGQIVG